MLGACTIPHAAVQRQAGRLPKARPRRNDDEAGLGNRLRAHRVFWF